MSIVLNYSMSCKKCSNSNLIKTRKITIIFATAAVRASQNDSTNDNKTRLYLLKNSTPMVPIWAIQVVNHLQLSGDGNEGERKDGLGKIAEDCR